MKWIPITERLPNNEERNNGVIITYTVNGEPYLRMTSGVQTTGRQVFGTSFDEIYSDGRVTAWMPLPEPYVRQDRYFIMATNISYGVVSNYKVKDRSQSDKTVFQSNVWNESKAVCDTLNKLHSEKR